METVKAKSLKVQMFEALDQSLSKEGFKLNASRGAFIRKRTPELSDIFQLVCPLGSPGWRVQPDVGVRIETIENIYHQIAGFEKKYQKGTCTVGSSVGIILAGDARRCEFGLATAADLPAVVQGVERVFHEFALPYFERYGSIEAIDELLNTDPLQPTPHKILWDRYAIGLITAKLLGRANFEELARIARERVALMNKGAFMPKIEALLALLETQPPLAT